MNKVFIVGYAGSDAEQRTTQGGVKYARVSLSTSYGGYKKQDGTDVPERTQWHHCVGWNNLADTMAKYLKKGMKCAVTGRIEYGTYKNAQGVDIPTTEIVVEELTLMSQAQGVQPQQQPQPHQPQAQYQQGGYQQQPATAIRPTPAAATAGTAAAAIRRLSTAGAAAIWRLSAGRAAVSAERE